MSREDWEPFEQLRKERKIKKASRRDDWEMMMRDDPDWTKHHDTHWSTTLLGDRLDYWPGPKRWRWRGVTMTGDVFAFIKARKAD